MNFLKKDKPCNSTKPKNENMPCDTYSESKSGKETAATLGKNTSQPTLGFYDEDDEVEDITPAQPPPSKKTVAKEQDSKKLVQVGKK